MTARVPLFQPAPPKRLTWEEVTDWYIPEDCKQEVLVYPGAIKADGELLVHAKAMLEVALWHISQATPVPVDFNIEYQGSQMRAHRQTTVGGTLIILRRIANKLPELSGLGLPAEVVRLLTQSNFAESGGLVLVTGEPGHGKSTTCAAILVERVRQYGYFCLTVEDPPEFPMHNEYRAANGRIGQIIQVPARSESFAFDLKDALRCYPSNMKGSMLLVGEVRDGNAAAQLLRAAVNGQLVFTTFHAGDVIAALERILSLATKEMGENEARSLLAHSLRGVLHQRIVQGVLSLTVLMSMSSRSQVAAQIKTGALPQLSTALEAQRTALANGRFIDHIRTSHTVGA